MTARQSWDKYFLDIAKQISTRGTCDRLRVGAVFVRDNRILATGYNGALPGQQHCDDVGHMMHNGSCIRSIHAETNAIAQASKHGVSLDDSFLYVTHLPCLNCYKIVLATGCKRVYFGEWYGATPVDTYRLFQGMSRLERVKNDS